MGYQQCQGTKSREKKTFGAETRTISNNQGDMSRDFKPATTKAAAKQGNKTWNSQLDRQGEGWGTIKKERTETKEPMSCNAGDSWQGSWQPMECCATVPISLCSSTSLMTLTSRGFGYIRWVVSAGLTDKWPEESVNRKDGRKWMCVQKGTTRPTWWGANGFCFPPFCIMVLGLARKKKKKKDKREDIIVE